MPAAATAPALILVGFLMAAQIVKIDFAKLETAIPAFITLLLIPLTYSISHGIGFGFIAFARFSARRPRARRASADVRDGDRLRRLLHLGLMERLSASPLLVILAGLS